MVEIIASIQPIISLIISLATLIGIFFAVYKFSKDPDIKNSEAISLIQQRCSLLHGTIDEDISLIKNNHLKHIEDDLKKQSENITKIFTILEERLPRK